MDEMGQWAKWTALDREWIEDDRSRMAKWREGGGES